MASAGRALPRLRRRRSDDTGLRNDRCRAVRGKEHRLRREQLAQPTTRSFASHGRRAVTHRPLPAILSVTLLMLAVGCGSAATTSAPGQLPDQPVPPDEPRAELHLEVDLHPAQDCEEVFDLALYEDRGVELIAWDDAKGTCEGRRITLRYLSRKLDANGVQALVREHAASVRAAQPPAPPAASSPTRPAPDSSSPPASD